MPPASSVCDSLTRVHSDGPARRAKAWLMTNVTQIISQLEHADSTAAERLLPLVYKELRQLAVAKLAHEKPGRTLQATALVHEAYQQASATVARVCATPK